MASDETTGGTSLQRAALVLSTLGHSAARRITAGMSPEQRRALRAEQRRLERLPGPERRRMLESVTQACRASGESRISPPDPPTPDPPTLPAALAPTAASSPGVGEDTDLIPCHSLRDAPFSYLRDADAGLVARVLRDEPAAIIALVAIHAPAGASEEALAMLPPELSQAVALSIAEVGEPSPGALRCVSDGLGDEVRALAEEGHRKRQGVRAMVRALSAAGDETIVGSLTALTQRDPELAAEVARELDLPPMDAPGRAPIDPAGADAQQRPLLPNADAEWARFPDGLVPAAGVVG